MSRLKEKISTHTLKKYLTSAAIFLVFLACPEWETDDFIGEAQYFSGDSHGSTHTIEDVIRLPARRWGTTDHRSWLDVLRGPQETWTKLHIPPAPKDKIATLVATNSFPMHRNIEYYLVQSGVIVSTSVNHVATVQEPEQIKSRDNRTGIPGTITFSAIADMPQDLYVKSQILGAGMPRPRIMTGDAFIAERTFLDLITGILGGAAISIILYNLAVGLAARQVLYFRFALFLTGILCVAFTASSTAERLLPRFATDANLYSLFTAEAVAMAIAGLNLFKRAFQTKALSSQELKKESLMTTGLSAVIAVSLPWISAGLRPAILTVFMLLQIGVTGYIDSKNSRQELTRQVSFGIQILVMPLLISILAWYQVIKPHYFRTMSFLFGGVGAGLYFASTVAVRMKEIRAKRQELIEQIKRDSRALAAAGLARGDMPHALEQAEITVMFIDIAAFSQLAAPLPSQLVFTQLSQRLGDMAKIVRDFGGNIDRSLGDGLLCFFGYRTGETPEHNTQRAFLAARKIQELTVATALAHTERNKKYLLMPVRIGIHSCKVVMGNIGGGSRIDFTMIGSGVNFAARLEAACSPFKLMLSDVCFSQLQNLGYGTDEFSRVGISIKHKADLITSFEYDPFVGRKEELRQAERTYFKQLGLEARDQRQTVRDQGALVLQSDDDALVIKDLSLFGFRGHSQRQFGRQARLRVKVLVADQSVTERLKTKFVDELTVEVRWSNRTTDGSGGFDHGLKILGSSLQQREFLYSQLAPLYTTSPAKDPDQLTQEVA